jgi:tyrosine-protein kinase Etk/Wzc
MTDTPDHVVETKQPTSIGDERIPLGTTFLDFFMIIARWRRFIVWFVLTVTILTTIIALVSPKWYKATASVFPAEQTNLFSGLEGISSLMKNFSPVGRLASLAGPTEAERYVGILKSDNALLKIIDKFDLTKVYNISKYPRLNTIKELTENTQFEITEEGTLQINVYDKDPVRAADMANYFVQTLNEINSNLQVQNARGNRAFIEQRYNKNLEDMRKSEEALKTFQLKFGVVAMPEQLEASIKAGAAIYAQLVTKEVELNVLRRTFSESHPSALAAQVEVDEIRKKIKELNDGTNTTQDEMKIFVPYRQTPQLAADYIRLYRDVEIQYKILQFITPLYEQAKVEEQRNTPSVVILDKALVPERKAKPKGSIYALVAFVVSLLISLLTVFILEALKRFKELDPLRFNAIVNFFRSDWFGLKWKSTGKNKSSDFGK